MPKTCAALSLTLSLVSRAECEFESLLELEELERERAIAVDRKELVII